MKYDGQMRCPLKGNLSIEVSKISLNKQFPLLPLLPSGQYLNDIKFFEGDHSTLIGNTKSYMQIIEKIIY